MGHLLKAKSVDSGGECAHFSFKKCPVDTHNGASAKFIINSRETDYSVETVRGCVSLKK
jgi:hypothetical protein